MSKIEKEEKKGKDLSKKEKTKKKLTKEEKKQLKNIKKVEKNYTSLKKKAKIIAIICVSIILIEVIIMLIMNYNRESKITYFDTLYSIENVDDEYYIAAGSSNFHDSRYNESFIYEYEDGIIKDQINKAYALQAKLVKYDKELNVVFEKTFECDYDSTFYHAVSVSDGFIAVGSYVYEKDQLSINTRDGLIAKYDLEGNFLWSKNYQVLGDTEFKKVIVEEDGFVVVGQSIYENMEIGNHETGGGIIVKYDFDGNVLWENSYGGNKSGIYNDVVRVSDGYIACGKDAYNYGMLTKYDLEGNRVWTKNYANTDSYGMSDIELKDDKLYIASSYNVSEEVDENNEIIYAYDACIFVYDLNGELLDIYEIGGNSEERFNALMLLDDSIIAVGHTSSSDIKIDALNYKKEMNEGMLVEFSYEGKVLKTTAYGGKKNDILNDIVVSILKTEDVINQTKSFTVVGYSNSKVSLFKGNNKDYQTRVLEYNQELELSLEK